MRHITYSSVIKYFTIFLLLVNLHVYPQGKWMQKSNFGGTARYGSVGFSIANKGYIGMGYDGADRNDLWEWDQAANTWTQKANCPGPVRRVSVGFSIGNKGYIAAGYNGSFLNDLWEWDQVTNTWLQRADIPTAGRYGAACFVIGNKGYVGCGNSGSANGPYFDDLWEWDQATNTWIQKASYPGGAKYGVSGFALGNKGYFGLGYDNNITAFYNDLWEWDQATNNWSQKASLPCAKRHYSTSFSIGAKGYIGLGQGIGAVLFKDFWEFDASANTWKQKANCAGGNRWLACGFSIGSKGYAGSGLYSNNSSLADLWEYDTLTLAISNNTNPCGNTVSFTSNITGADSYLWNFGDGTTSTIANPAKNYNSSGNYNIMLIVFWSCGSDTAYQSISINSSSIFTSRNLSICNGDSIFIAGEWQKLNGIYYDTLASVNGCDSIIESTLTVAATDFYGYDTTINSGEIIQLSIAGGNSYYWNTGESSPNIFVSPSKSTAYLVTITDAAGCPDTAVINVMVDNSESVISVPSIFSPNKDGINDFIKVHGYGIKEYKFVIYDRWGEKIFEDNGSSLPAGQAGVEGGLWDGTHNGKTLNSAVFVYILDAVFADGTEFHEKGNITLIR